MVSGLGGRAVFEAVVTAAASELPLGGIAGLRLLDREQPMLERPGLFSRMVAALCGARGVWGTRDCVPPLHEKHPTDLKAPYQPVTGRAIAEPFAVVEYQVAVLVPPIRNSTQNLEHTLKSLSSAALVAGRGSGRT